MANYQNILRQAHQAIADVADNADSWRAFLRSAAYTTHYAFPNQALIYSQRPGATMLADIDTWNRAAGRWVNRGAHGVASLGTGNMAGNVRYLFDIKDTHPAGKGAKPLGWQITDANRYSTLQALQEKHNAESLPEIFGLQAALFVAQHGKQLDADLQNAVIGSTLEWAKPQEQTAIFANLITQSAVYMAAVRCGLGDSAVPQNAFADIDRFDTESTVLALGNAVNRAGRQMFAEIGAVVKSIDSVAKTQPKQYDENVSKTNQQEVQDHGYDESERVSGAQDGNEGNAQTAGRENRSAAGEVPAREPLPAVRQDAAGRDAVQRPETDRAALLGAGGADHHEAAGQQPGTGQEQRPVGLDRAHEQSASAGGGIGDAHRDEPVNTEPTTAESEPSLSAVSVSDEIELPESVGRGDLAEETAAAIGLPSLEQQQETIRQLQPRASWQPPIKDDGTHIDEQDIVDVLVMGSGFCEGRFRIQEFFSATVLPTVKEQADWLKKEYGIGGRTWDFRDGERGFLDYDAKGLKIKRYASDNDPDYFRLLPWNEVARRLHLLVHNDQYLDENNKQAYEKWEAEQQAKRDARQAEIDYAEKTIANFCEREGLGAPDFSDLTHIDLAYSTTGDGEHEIQVYANFLRNEIVYLVDGSFVDSARFDNTRALAKEGIEDIEFSQFIDDAEAAYEAYQERYKPKPMEKRPLAAGDTVYLENDHPFTVEEIGIFDVHLRDEDFPLIGRAVNRAEFARLLAANPKNNALAAPELPNAPDTGEAAEVVEGEVLEPTDEPAEETSSGFGEQVLQAAELIALKEAYEPNNYIPPQEPAPPRTPREKFAANITAIRTLKSIEKRMADGGPHANGEEQEILAQYSGWGGLSDAFEPNKDSWHSEYTELKSLLTEEEYAAARSSTLTAFYMAELFTMQRYLQRETLEQHGLSSFDAWASTFGETVTAVELAPEGTGYRTKTRFSKFYNLPELMSMFKQVADVQTADMLNLPVPKLVGGKPINVALPPSPQQKQMVADLADRAEEIRAGNVDPTEDNMLKVTNDGRKLALDQRLIDPNLPENPNDKVHACAENVYRIWNDTKEKRLTQLVFCDLSTPKPDGFNVYDDLRNLLISMGIPENEVQFIHSANTEVKKAELFAKVRSGDVRVLMGSTGKMGAGTNVQRLLVATHHLDCGWKPSDIEQRNGRMIRQGNTNAEVYEYRYVTESSFDSYMWQLLETKQKFIGQIVTSKSPARSADDLDDAALSYAEVKALATGNPMIKEKMDLDIQVARLKTLKTAYNNEHYRLEDAITQGFPAEMRKTAQQLENAKADTILLQQNTKHDADGKDVFAISLMDTVYTKREDAGKALLGLLGMAMNRTEPVSIGRYKGFDLQIAYFAMDKMYLAYLVGSGINPVQLGADAVGNTVRLDNCLHNLPQSVTDLESKLVQLQKQLENAKEQLAQPFAQADELAEKSKRLAELEALLNLNEKDIVLDTVPDEEQQCRSDNRQRGQAR